MVVLVLWIYDKKAPPSKSFYTRIVNIAIERDLQKNWNEEPDIPEFLKFLLPLDGHPKLQLYESGNETEVKLGEWGNRIHRAYYKHEGRIFYTNVTFSTRAFPDNPSDGTRYNWVVRKNAEAVVLFLYGKGWVKFDFHVAENIMTHFNRYGVDVVSLDLPLHVTREMVLSDADAKTNIKVLGSFVQQYIPPHIPLFVVGHNLGSVFAEKLMTIDRPSEDFFFHGNLKGAVILSNGVNTVPGKSREERYHAHYFKRLKKWSETEALESALPIFLPLQD